MLNNKANILILDDDKIFCNFIKSWFDENNICHCPIENDPVVALDTIKIQEFDLILLDIKMPKMNGIEWLEKAMQFKNNLKVIAITAFYDENGMIKKLKELNVIDIMPKPYDYKQLSLILSKRIADLV